MQSCATSPGLVLGIFPGSTSSSSNAWLWSSASVVGELLVRIAGEGHPVEGEGGETKEGCHAVHG